VEIVKEMSKNRIKLHKRWKSIKEEDEEEDDDDDETEMFL
jgi:hypothetical protein